MRSELLRLALGGLLGAALWLWLDRKYDSHRWDRDAHTPEPSGWSATVRTDNAIYFYDAYNKGRECLIYRNGTSQYGSGFSTTSQPWPAREDGICMVSGEPTAASPRTDRLQP